MVLRRSLYRVQAGRLDDYRVGSAGTRGKDRCVADCRSHIRQTAQAIIKETVAARKNTSPQNLYEISQLYGAGALKVGAVALQCVGFNNALYRAIIEQAATCKATGRWRVGGVPGWMGSPRTSIGEVTDAMTRMSIKTPILPREENGGVTET